MEDIKRYVLNSHGLCDMCGMEQLEQWENPATDKYISETDHKAVVETIKADLLESYKAIVRNYITNNGFSDFCIHCESILDRTLSNHKDNCIVLKAEKYIKESN